MNRLLIVLLWITFVSFSVVQAAHSNSINLLSSEYHIWGNVHAAEEPYPIGGKEIFESYDIYSISPVDYYVTFEEEYPSHGFLYRAESNTDLFYQYVLARSSSYGGYGGTLHPLSGNDTFAESSWTFQTPSNSVIFDFNWTYLTGRIFTFSEVWLTDLTTGTDMYYFKTTYLSEHNLWLEMNLDPTHIYNLKMYSMAESADDYTGSHLSLSVNVPEPHINFLLVTGFILLLSLSSFRHHRRPRNSDR